MGLGPFGSGSYGTGVFSNSPFYNTSTLIDAVLRATGHSTPADETAKRAVVLTAIQNRYALVTTMQRWDWLYQEIDFTFKEPYETGTLNVTELSAVFTGVGTAFNVNAVNNNVLSIPSRNETYLIDTVESSTQITCEGQYAGETDTGLAYKIIKPIYTMPSDLEAIEGIQIDNVGKMVPVGRQEFQRIKQHNPGHVGAPRYFTEVGRRAADGVRHIEVYPAPDKNYTGRLFYGVNIQSLSDSTDNYPLLPDRHRAVLFFGAMADMFMYLRDFAGSEKYEGLYDAALINMRNDTKITDSKIQFQPSRNYRNRSNKSKRRIRSYSESDFASEE